MEEEAIGPASTKIDVLCIGGTGQNGATLLSRMLEQLPGYVAVGELGRLWDDGIVDNVECGCGSPFHDCPFWTEVGKVAFGGWDGVDAVRATNLRDDLLFKHRRLPNPLALPLILWPQLSTDYRRKLEEYADLLERLYVGISEVSPATIIVDSMKLAAHVYTVSRLPTVDLRVIHLVRDSRGVAYSNTKWVRRHDVGTSQLRARRRPGRTAIRWVWINLAFHALARRGVPYLFVKYEAFVRSPRSELRRIAKYAGAPIGEGDLSFVRAGEVNLIADHLVAGNRMRFASDAVPLRVDEEWRSKLAPAQRLAVSMLTLPLLRWYRYRL